MGGGSAMVGSDLFNPCVKYVGSRSGPCVQQARPSLIIPGAVVVGVGVTALVVGIAFPNRHVSQGEAQRLADEYNSRLKREIETTPPVRESKLRLEILPVVSPTGAGLILGASF